MLITPLRKKRLRMQYGVVGIPNVHVQMGFLSVLSKNIGIFKKRK